MCATWLNDRVETRRRWHLFGNPPRRSVWAAELARDGGVWDFTNGSQDVGLCAPNRCPLTTLL